MSILNDSHWITTAYGRSGYGTVTRGIFTEMIRRETSVPTPTKYNFTFENYDWDRGMKQPKKDFPYHAFKTREKMQKHYLESPRKNLIHHRTVTLQDTNPLPKTLDSKNNIFITGYPLEPAPPPYFENALTHYDAIITPSEYSKRIITNTKFDSLPPIHVVPWGHDPLIFNPLPDFDNKYDVKRNKQKPFTFSAVFQWQGLKSPYELINAYLQEFNTKDNVRLILRTHTDGSEESYLWLYRTIKKWYTRMWQFSQRTDLPYIELIINDLSLWEMAKFYQTADVFVHPSKAEFFGLPVLEAMASGTPVVATNYHAVGEFYKDTELAIQGYKQNPPTQEYDNSLYDRKFGVYINTPYIAEIQFRIRRAFEMSQEELYKKAEEGIKQVKKLTWANTVNKLMEIEI